MLTCIEQWEEWVARCAIGRCSHETATALRRFASFRFGRYLERCLGQHVATGFLPDDHSCFHLFETHCCVARARTGKRYKEWLVRRSCGAADAASFERGASLLVRDVVKSFVQRECPPSQQISADAVIDGTDGLTLADLLPAASDHNRDDVERADVIARAVLFSLSEAHRIVVLARGSGIPLSAASLLTLLKVGKSRAATLWAEVYDRVAAETRRQVPEGDRGCWLSLALQASEQLRMHIFLQERVEKRWFAHFKGVEGLYDE